MMSIKLTHLASLLTLLTTHTLAGPITTNLKRAPQFFNGANNRYMQFLTAAIKPGSVKYKPYKGNGTTTSGWPSETDWLDFNMLWYLNTQTWINKVCDNTEEETADILRAINSVSETTNVDPRFILAIIITESRGCVRVKSTALSVANPGLMQAYGPHAKGSCYEPTLLNPCPYTQIEQMVTDGTATNPAGVDLVDLIQHSNQTDVSRFYIAARLYNSGPLSLGKDGDLGAPGANRCYSADIANRLVGYTGEGCGGTKRYQKINGRT